MMETNINENYLKNFSSILIFTGDGSKILDKKHGIFYLEYQDLLSVVKNLLFDTICHEHLEYYSLTIVNKMLVKNYLKLVNVDKNEINEMMIGSPLGNIRFSNMFLFVSY